VDPGFPNERILTARFLRVDLLDQPGIEAVHLPNVMVSGGRLSGARRGVGRIAKFAPE